MSQQGLERNYANYNPDIIKGLIEEMITNADCQERTKSRKLEDYDEFEEIPDLIDLPEPEEHAKLEPLALELETLFYPTIFYRRRP